MSAKALRTGERSWLSGRIDSEEQTLLKKFFARMVNGIAWTQSEHWSSSEAGLPAMQKLHEEVVAHLSSPVERAALEDRSEWAAWRYLYVTTVSYGLAYSVATAALGWFDKGPKQVTGETSAGAHHATARRAAARKEIDAYYAFVAKDPKAYLQEEPVNAVRVWWNLSQLAAVCQDDILFMRCYNKLQEPRDGPVSELKHIMMDDLDTKPMVLKPGFDDGVIGGAIAA